MRYTPRGKIVPAEDMNIIFEASGYADKAKQLFDDAQRKLAGAEQRGHQTGYAEGFRAGLSEGLAALDHTIAELRQQWQIRDADIYNLAEALVLKVYGDPGNVAALRALVRQAVSEQAAQIQTRLCLSSDDYHAIGEAVLGAGNLDIGDRISGIEVDPNLKPGEITLRSPRGQVSIGLAHQLMQVRKALMDQEPSA